LVGQRLFLKETFLAKEMLLRIPTKTKSQSQGK
jgi:hypothetical protein